MESDITNGIPFEQWNKDMPNRCYDISLCPICGKRLIEKYEGLVCRNSVCRLYFKLGSGWVFLTDKSKFSASKNMSNLFFNSSARLRLDKSWIEVKRKAIIRDNYRCTKCNNEFDTWKCLPLHVHHIIPASKEMALYLDLDNLITLCEKCHNQIHSEDKYKFGGKKEHGDKN